MGVYTVTVHITNFSFGAFQVGITISNPLEPSEMDCCLGQARPHNAEAGHEFGFSNQAQEQAVIGQRGRI